MRTSVAREVMLKISSLGLEADTYEHIKKAVEKFDNSFSGSGYPSIEAGIKMRKMLALNNKELTEHIKEYVNNLPKVKKLCTPPNDFRVRNFNIHE